MLNCVRLGHFCRRKARETTRKELERTTDIGIVDMTEFTHTELNEACLIQGQKFVASTATFNEEWDIISLRPELRPKKYVIWHL